MSDSKQTTNHETIKSWAEARNGVPTFVKGTENGNEGVLRIHFPAASKNDEDFDRVMWEQFFDVFEEKNLSFLYQEEKENGEKSTFHKFVSR